MPRPHPDLRWRRLLDGSLEVRVDGMAQPIARARPMPDGRWFTAVWPVQKGPERTAVAGSERQAVLWLRNWCRGYAWRVRPNVALRPGSICGQALGKV